MQQQLALLWILTTLVFVLGWRLGGTTKLHIQHVVENKSASIWNEFFPPEKCLEAETNYYSKK
jgi:hypothetical protein